MICEQLTQPESLNVRPGQPLTIRCQVSYSVSTYGTHWIRQPEGHALEWIGYIYTGGKSVKDSLSSKFSLAVDSSTKTVTLQGQNMQLGDSAVYYCARRHSVTNGCEGWTKTLHPWGVITWIFHRGSSKPNTSFKIDYLTHEHQLRNRGGDKYQALWNILFTLLFIDHLGLLINLPTNLFEIYKQGYILLTTQAAISCEDVSLVCYPNLCKITIMKPTFFSFLL